MTCTTKEQGNALLQLGVSPDTADVTTIYGKAWSLAALFALLPTEVKLPSGTYRNVFRKWHDSEFDEDFYEIAYEDDEQGIAKGYLANYPDPVTAIVEMLKIVLK